MCGSLRAVLARLLGGGEKDYKLETDSAKVLGSWS